MHKHVIPLYIMVVLIFISCSQTTEPKTEPEKWETVKIPTDSIIVGEKTDTTIAFTARSWGMNGCYVYSHNEIDRVGRNINITIYGKYPTSAYCTMALISIYSQIQIHVPKADTYYFHFWNYEVSSYDTTIITP